MIFLSVIIPTKNRSALLRQTLQSLIHQTYPQENFEIIVVDNNSEDDTKEIVYDFMDKFRNIHYVFAHKPGLHEGRHAGLENSNGEILVYTDDDIQAFPTWLEGIYESFLKNDGYEIITFIDPSDALNYIKDLSNFDDLLVTLDIRMKNLNGIQLYQQIKAIDPTIKILFVTALDILDELLTIVPGISKEQIMRKPVDKKIFTNTVKKLLT